MHLLYQWSNPLPEEHLSKVILVLKEKSNTLLVCEHLEMGIDLGFSSAALR